TLPVLLRTRENKHRFLKLINIIETDERIQGLNISSAQRNMLALIRSRVENSISTTKKAKS
ncbi:MAG: hypothetical protein AAGB12_14310, partial [Pseudomonadota bacterium]